MKICPKLRSTTARGTPRANKYLLLLLLYFTPLSRQIQSKRKKEKPRKKKNALLCIGFFVCCFCWLLCLPLFTCLLLLLLFVALVIKFSLFYWLQAISHRQRSLCSCTAQFAFQNVFVWIMSERDRERESRVKKRLKRKLSDYLWKFGINT